MSVTEQFHVRKSAVPVTPAISAATASKRKAARPFREHLMSAMDAQKRHSAGRNAISTKPLLPTGITALYCLNRG